MSITHVVLVRVSDVSWISNSYTHVYMLCAGFPYMSLYKLSLARLQSENNM